jgi:NAD(P)-dependent dehydrogenase (short-subunit alcohol dehydrogenase family)
LQVAEEEVRLSSYSCCCCCDDPCGFPLLLLFFFFFLPLEDMSIETMEHILDINLMGNIHSIKAAVPFIKSSKSAPASIAIFSSQAGQVCALLLT